MLIFTGCAKRVPSQIPEPGFNLFSKQQDVQLGQEAAAQVREEYEVVPNPNLQAYVDRVGNRLAATPAARESGFPFSFTFLNNPQVNAFALPGGPMFVFTGLVKEVDTEAQLAGVMAHEMSHVILRHGTNQVSKAQLLQLPAIFAGQAAGGGSLLGQLAQVGIGLGYNSILLKFSRSDESDADALGARIMAHAGYNPLAMAQLFEKLEESGGPRAPEFLSDHPSTGHRLRDVQAVIETMPPRSYTFSTGQFSGVKRAVAQLPPPRKQPRQVSN